MQTLEIIFKGVDVFVVLDGVKVAKRARPRTAAAKWVPIKPGVTVRNGDAQVEVEFNGKTARLQKSRYD